VFWDGAVNPARGIEIMSITEHVKNLDKCKNADQYQAHAPPRCNWGDPCRVCREKWIAAQQAEMGRLLRQS